MSVSSSGQWEGRGSGGVILSFYRIKGGRWFYATFSDSSYSVPRHIVTGWTVESAWFEMARGVGGR